MYWNLNKKKKKKKNNFFLILYTFLFFYKNETFNLFRKKNVNIVFKKIQMIFF